jgi:transposase
MRRQRTRSKPTSSRKIEPEKKTRSPSPHGRRKHDLAGLPVEEFRIVPDEVLASIEKGWKLIGEETCERLAFRRALYFCMRVVREKWVRTAPNLFDAQPSAIIATGRQPDAVWPNVMADPSVIVDVLLSKYD